MTYVSVAGQQYPAVITGRMSDKEWDGRESKSIKLEMTYTEAVNIWTNGAVWSILCENIVHVPSFDEDGIEITDENGEPVMIETIETEEFDNSEYSLAGCIIDHRDGSITVKMGKPTTLESAEAQNMELSDALNILIGGSV